MSAILDQVFDRSRSSVTEASEPENRFFTGSGREDFARTLAQSSGHGRGPATTGFAAFVNQFDGLRIPSSPLHEF